MRINFNPLDWYWMADDGRLFSSKTQAAAQPTDADYLAWRDFNGGPTPWPRDATGAQTTAALQTVLADYGLFADLASYAANVRYNKEVGGLTINGVLYPSDRETQAKLVAAVALAQVDNTQTFVWKLSDGTFSPQLTAAQMVSVAQTIGSYVNACFAKEKTVDAEITSGTITTRAQIDAAFAS